MLIIILIIHIIYATGTFLTVNHLLNRYVNYHCVDLRFPNLYNFYRNLYKKTKYSNLIIILMMIFFCYTGIIYILILKELFKNKQI